MAVRPVYIASLDSLKVEVRCIEFKWYSGYSIGQKQKSIEDLHFNAKMTGLKNILEVSSKSTLDIGVNLSAFNLKTKTQRYDKEFSVETAFQGSKVFEGGGPYSDIIFLDSRSAKTDQRIKNSGRLVSFCFFGKSFGLHPKTFFYDWLYINTLLKNKHLIEDVMKFSVFTDIEFNPKKSINCQAFSLALFRTLMANSPLTGDKIEPDEFEKVTRDVYRKLNRDNAISQCKLNC